MNPDTANANDTCELVAFLIDGQEFCVDIMDVREIRGWTKATPMPHAPPFFCGVINLRGAVLPVVDLARRLGLGATEASARHVIIVVSIGERLIGLLVDAVSDIIATVASAAQPTPDVARDDVKKCVKSIFAIDGRMISWLTLDQILPELEAAPV